MTSDRRRLVAVLFTRYGPYHLARLRGAIAAGRGANWEVRGLEVTHVDAYYAWRPLDLDLEVPLTTLIPGRSLEQVSGGEIREALLQTLDRLDPDAVAIAGYTEPYLLAALAWCRRKGRAAVLMSESKRDDTLRLLPFEVLKRQVVSLFDAGLVGGAAQRAYAAQLGIPVEAVTLGYDAVDNEFFAAQADAARASEAGWSDKLGIPHPFVLASCRFLRRKNVPGLVRAYGSYRETIGPDGAWDLAVLGDGEDGARIKRAIGALGLAGCVHLHGFRQIEELPAWYALARLFVHVPFREQWGLVVNEAMASATPAVVSSSAGASELIREDVSGWIVDPKSTDAIAQALVRAHRLGPEKLRGIGINAREDVREWGPERFGLGLMAALDVAMQRSSQRGAGACRAGRVLDRLLVPVLRK